MLGRSPDPRSDTVPDTTLSLPLTRGSLQHRVQDTAGEPIQSPELTLLQQEKRAPGVGPTHSRAPIRDTPSSSCSHGTGHSASDIHDDDDAGTTVTCGCSGRGVSWSSTAPGPCIWPATVTALDATSSSSRSTLTRCHDVARTMSCSSSETLSLGLRNSATGPSLAAASPAIGNGPDQHDPIHSDVAPTNFKFHQFLAIQDFHDQRPNALPDHPDDNRTRAGTLHAHLPYARTGTDAPDSIWTSPCHYSSLDTDRDYHAHSGSGGTSTPVTAPSKIPHWLRVVKDKEPGAPGDRKTNIGKLEASHTPDPNHRSRSAASFVPAASQPQWPPAEQLLPRSYMSSGAPSGKRMLRFASYNLLTSSNSLVNTLVMSFLLVS